MLHLHLFRHAESSWNQGQSEDFERPLNPRGRVAATVMAGHMALSGLAPDVILCSTARRARETLALAVPTFVRDCTIHIGHNLYLADAATLMELVRTLPDTAEQCMLIGHNPGLQQLALLLAGAGDVEELAVLRANFPTAAVAEITFTLSHWAEIAPGAGRLRRFLTPRALPAGD